MSAAGSENTALTGTLFGFSAFLIWGFAPIFWKSLHAVPPLELIAHRIIWSLVFLAIFLTIQRRWSAFRAILGSRRALVFLLFSTLCLAGNWFVFVYAVLTERVLETSLGYFMNPLVNVFMGFVFLGDPLRRGQKLAVAIAVSGVLYLTLQGQSIPWMAVFLAISFAMYGLLRKLAHVEALPGLTVEALILAPFALAFLLSLGARGTGSFGASSPQTHLLMIGTGIITAVPLLCFGMGVRRISLTALGFLQYTAPTVSFLLGIFLYGENFSRARLIAFTCIWIALVLYSLESIHDLGRKRTDARRARRDAMERLPVGSTEPDEVS